MIEINLVPGSAKSSKRRKGKLSLGGLPKLSGRMPKFDRSVGLMGVAWVGGFGLLAWMALGGRHHLSTLAAEIEAAQLDSIRLESAIKAQVDLEARRNIVAQKVSIVQEIDANRYVWAHIQDEVARAVPEYTWLVAIAGMQTDSGVKYPHFQIQGRTGNNFALTKYLQQLEQSPFIHGVRLKESQLVREDTKLVYAFMVEADYEPPPPDLLETVPLFANEQPDSTAAQQAAPSQRRAPSQPGSKAPGLDPKSNVQPKTGPQGGTVAPKAPPKNAPAAQPPRPGKPGSKEPR